MEYKHKPVLLEKALGYLNLKKDGYYIDCTLGGGGYTFAIAAAIGEKGKVLAIDADKLAIENAQLKIEKDKIKNIILSHENFGNLSKIIESHAKELSEKGADAKFDGIVFDLGLSSAQLEDSFRGFSFQLAGAPLDMAFGRTNDSASGSGGSTEEIVNHWTKDELARILKEYGEERFAWKIAGRIVDARKKLKRQDQSLKTVGELVEIINKAVPEFYRRGRINPATRTFQALRIATNDELNTLAAALPQGIKALKPGGRMVVVSYHSLEDRIAKRFFKQAAKADDSPNQKIKILTKKVILPDYSEAKANPRSRSAKLRAVEKI